MAPRKTYIVDFLLLTAVLIWGFNFPLMKSMYSYFHPITFNAVRFVIASVIMLGVLKLRGDTGRVDRQDWRRILWLGFLGNTLYPVAEADGYTGRMMAEHQAISTSFAGSYLRCAATSSAAHRASSGFNGISGGEE